LKVASKALLALVAEEVKESSRGKRGRSTERTKRDSPPTKRSKPADARRRLEAQQAKIAKKLKAQGNRCCRGVLRKRFRMGRSMYSCKAANYGVDHLL
jgi:hypothetical protein